MPRTLSYTEISTALRCFAQWDFAYGGRLAGSTLKTRETAPILSDGRAWGAGAAAWHAGPASLFDVGDAHLAMFESLNADAADAKRKERPIDPERVLDQYERLSEIFTHYAVTADQLPNLTQIEGELNVPIPSRGGKRGSNRYRFHCYLDGHTQDGHPWIVEFKLRHSLTPLSIVERQPQYRWYALAYALAHGIKGPVGVLVDERLNVPPMPARIVNGKKKGEKTPSHATDQLTTPERYLAACAEYDVEPQQGTLVALRARRWQQRSRLIFPPDQLAEAAQELTGAARLIRDLDGGALYPIRNGNRGNCQSCRFVGVCMDPTNEFLIDSLYTRTQPKRLRGPRPEGVR